MNLTNKICSVENCNTIAFYYVSDRKMFFCEDHKELAYKKQKNDAYDYDYSKAANYRNSVRISKLSKIK